MKELLLITEALQNHDFSEARKLINRAPLDFATKGSLFQKVLDYKQIVDDISEIKSLEGKYGEAFSKDKTDYYDLVNASAVSKWKDLSKALQLAFFNQNLTIEK